MPDKNTDFALVARFESTARSLALAVAALGASVLMAWVLDIAALKSLLPAWVTMKANTALGFLLAGTSLAAADCSRVAPGWRRAHIATAATLTLLGLLTLSEYAFAADFGIDQLLFAAPGALDSTAPPGRMALATAAGLTLTGLALLLLGSKRGTLASQGAALLGSLIGLLAILGYAYDVNALYGVGAYSSVALHTALGLLAINLGVLFAQPRRGLMAVVTSQSTGGVMVRRLLPFALTAPFLIGWLRIQSEQRGWVSAEFGVALVALTYVTLFSTFIWRTGAALQHSDRRRLTAEAARGREHAQLTGIIDSAMDAIIMADAAQRVILFNPAAEQMFGHPAANVIGGPLAQLLPQRFQASHGEKVEAFASTGTTQRRMGGLGAVTGLRANGEEFPIEASISQVHADGEKYYTVILRDITERLRVQEALRASEDRERVRSEELAKLLDAVPAAVWFAHDSEARVITGNQLAYQWLRIPQGSNLSQTTPRGYRQRGFTLTKDGVAIPPAEMPLQRSAAGVEIRDYEFDIVHPDGSSRRVLGNTIPLLDADGRSRGAISAFVDITARQEAERATQEAKAEAERANNAKSRFLAAASHDLRQPLSALILYTTILKDKVAPAEQPLLANMNDCLANLSELLTDLLDLSKLEAGVVTPTCSDFAFHDVLGNLQSAHAPEAQQKGLALRCVSSGTMAHTDPILFRRILGNLVSNAIRYSERGGVLVACRRRQGKTWVEVWDTGIGIPAHKTAEIFEEFKQLDDNKQSRGSGLGLAIVAKTAALLGLEISVRSRPGRGSVFAIELPLGRAEARPAQASPVVVYQSLRIALLEDNSLVRQALSGALESAGHQVLAAATGHELLAGLGSLPPDVVVSDYRLAEGETGFTAITALRTAMQSDLPAILITGDTDPQLVRNMADQGIVVLHKPVDLETLQAHLEDLTYRE